MPLRQLESLFTESPQRNYDKGQIILYAGDVLRNIYYIKNGYVKMYSISDSGEERLLLIFPPRGAFPIFPGALTGEPYEVKYFYQTMSKAKLYVAPQTELARILKNDHEASHLILNYVTEVAGDLVRRVGIIENKDAKNKIASLLPYLLKVCSKETSPGKFRMSLRITHQDIASMAGLTRETSSTQIKILENDGVIEQPKDGRLVIMQSKMPA